MTYDSQQEFWNLFSEKDSVSVWEKWQYKHTNQSQTNSVKLIRVYLSFIREKMFNYEYARKPHFTFFHEHYTTTTNQCFLWI